MKDMNSAIIEILSTIVFGSDYPLLMSTLEKIKLQRKYQQNPEALSLKINELTDSLKKSSELMSNIETEFIRQKEYTLKLQEEAETSQLISSLKKEEVEAVNRVIANTVEKSGRKSSRISVVWSAVFCLIGLFGGILLQYVFGLIN